MRKSWGREATENATPWRARDSREWNYTPDQSEQVPSPTPDDPDRTVPRWLGFDYLWDADAISEEATFGEPNAPDSIASPHGQGFTRRAKSGNKARKPASARGVPVDTGGKSADAVAGSVPWEGSRRNKRSVWTVATTPFPEAHFATFPAEIPEICIAAGSRPGDTILDLFGGAGTSGLVADRMGRNAILIELNPEYADMARRRISRDAPLFADVVQS